MAQLTQHFTIINKIVCTLLQFVIFAAIYNYYIYIRFILADFNKV